MTIKGNGTMAALAMLAAGGINATPSAIEFRPSPTFSTILKRGQVRSGFGSIKTRSARHRSKSSAARRAMAKASRKRNRK